jgi:hypothetical protein
MDVESEYLERKSTYDKVAVGLELEKQALERDCDMYQDECLKEESRFHELNCRTTISKIKLQKADQEKKWQTGNGQFMRDFKTLKDFYAVCFILYVYTLRLLSPFPPLYTTPALALCR